MTQYQINVSKEILHHLFSSNDTGLRELLTQVLDQILEQQRTEQINAEHYERTDERQGYRNGYKPHKLVTRVGTITLRVPQIRNGVFSTDLFKRYQRSEQALVLALMEMVLKGVSTRDVSDITAELCGTEFSATTVSELCKNLDPIVQSWSNRPLHGKKYPFLLVDALVIRIRYEHRITSFSALIGVGVDEEGYREVLGLMIGDSESEATWTSFFQSLKNRGLRGVDLVVSDNHRGLVKAVKTSLQGIGWQRCQVHFLRNILGVCPKARQRELAGYLKAVFNAPDIETARKLKAETQAKFAKAAPKAIQVLDSGFEEAVTVFQLPEYYRRRLRTTNCLERLIEEIRRRERVIRIFPNEASAFRLIGALLMEQSDTWITGKRYLSMTEYFQTCKDLASTQSTVVSLY